jgi:hypothetical protein
MGAGPVCSFLSENLVLSELMANFAGETITKR